MQLPTIKSRHALLLLPAILLGCMAAVTTFARPRNVIPPYPEWPLSSWRFDNTNILTDVQSTPALLQDIELVESWSGHALNMEGAGPKLFLVPALDEKGRATFAPATGTIRLWFRPAWTSSALGGKGPGSAARLWQLGTWGEKESRGWWWLGFDPSGEAIVFCAQNGNENISILKAPIQWQAGQWHQVALTYAPTGTRLALDGVAVAEGPASALIPLEEVRGLLGFCLGSDVEGQNLAQGQFEEVKLFAHELRAEDLARNHNWLASIAGLGPITLEEETARAAWLLGLRAGSAGSGQMMMSSNGLLPPPGESGTNGVAWTNSWAWTSGFDRGTNVFFWAVGYVVTNLTTNAFVTVTNGSGAGGIGELAYDLFSTTNLPGLSITNATWTWLARMASGQTLEMPDPPWPHAFYVLGVRDSDGDGLTDAYELWVTGTPTNDFTTRDSDGDGFSDAWELANGMNPAINELASPIAFGRNYIYDATGRLTGVNGRFTATFTQDEEGNITTVTR